MSKIDDLIQELCPDGVEYYSLGNLVEILDSKRKPVKKELRTSGNIPYYGANGIQGYVAEWIFDGTYILLGEDGSVITASGNPILNWVTGKIWVNNHAHILSQKQDGPLLRFLFYVLQGIDVSDIVRGVPPKLNQKNLRQIQVPVPPIEVQEEIVRVLDSFAELEAELEARRRQYAYYRDQLLSDIKDKYEAIKLDD